MPVFRWPGTIPAGGILTAQMARGYNGLAEVQKVAKNNEKSNCWNVCGDARLFELHKIGIARVVG